MEDCALLPAPFVLTTPFARLWVKGDHETVQIEPLRCVFLFYDRRIMYLGATGVSSRNT